MLTSHLAGLPRAKQRNVHQQHDVQELPLLRLLLLRQQLGRKIRARRALLYLGWYYALPHSDYSTAVCVWEEISELLVQEQFAEQDWYEDSCRILIVKVKAKG